MCEVTRESLAGACVPAEGEQQVTGVDRGESELETTNSLGGKCTNYLSPPVASITAPSPGTGNERDGNIIKLTLD